MRSAVSLMVAIYLEFCVVSSQENVARDRCCRGVSLVADEAEILLLDLTSKFGER